MSNTLTLPKPVIQKTKPSMRVEYSRNRTTGEFMCRKYCTKCGNGRVNGKYVLAELVDTLPDSCLICDLATIDSKQPTRNFVAIDGKQPPSYRRTYLKQTKARLHLRRAQMNFNRKPEE